MEGGVRQREVELAFHDYWVASTESNGTNPDETIDSAIADCDRRQRWDRPGASGAPYVKGLYEIDDQDGRPTVDIPGRWREPIRAATGDAGRDTVVVQVTRRPDGSVLSIAVAPLRDRVSIERTEAAVVVHAGSQRLTVMERPHVARRRAAVLVHRERVGQQKNQGNRKSSSHGQRNRAYGGREMTASIHPRVTRAGGGRPETGDDVQVWRGPELVGSGTIVGWLRRRTERGLGEGVPEVVFRVGEALVAAEPGNDVCIPVVRDGAGEYVPAYPRCPDCDNVLVHDDHRADASEPTGRVCPRTRNPVAGEGPDWVRRLGCSSTFVQTQERS